MMIARRLGVLAAGLWLSVVIALRVDAAPDTAPTIAESGAPADRVVDVRVISGTQPIAGAAVVVLTGDDQVTAATDRDGHAKLRIWTNRDINGVVALDPERGAGGRWDRARPLAGATGDSVSISLEPARPHTFRVVDTDGKPARLVPLVVSGYRTSTSGWVPTGAFAAAQLHTDARGEAVVRWLPRDLIQVELDVFDDRWMIDEVDPAQIDKPVTLVKVRRLHAVEGRLSMPGHASPAGLMIAGLGTSDTSSLAIHRVSARVRRDGTFTLYLASGYGYWLGVDDAHWASDPWIGLVGKVQNQPRGPITLVAYPALTLTVQVTRGPKHEPVANAYLAVAGDQLSMLWQQARQQARPGAGGAFGCVYTDRGGLARIPVCKGSHAIWLEAGDWQEMLTAAAGADKPASVEFHRPWADKRTISGRLTLHGHPHQGSPATRLRAWNVSDPAVAADGIVEADGRFTVKIDAPDVYLLALDSKNRLSAAGRVGVKDSTANLELIPTASLSGLVVSSAGKPLAGHAVEALPTQGPLHVDFILGVDKNGNVLPNNMGNLVANGMDFQMGQVVVRSAACDAQGRFKIDLVPAEMRVRVVAGSPAEARGKQFALWPDRFRVDVSQDVYLEPGEIRDNVRLVALPDPSSTPTPEQESRELEQSLKRVQEEAAREGSRMLVVLEGELPKRDSDVTQRLFEADVPPAFSRYELFCIDADEVRPHAALLKRMGWEQPASGDVALIVLDATGAKIAAQQFKLDGTAAPRRRAAEFITRHAPPARDARQLLTAAQREARDSGRRLWVVETNSVSGDPPCGELSRWMDEQRALLAKDYVVLRIGPHHDYGEDVLTKFQTNGNANSEQDRGPPWIAIAEPDGKVLATSLGPLGNIGFPTNIEGKRHLKKMIKSTARHITPAECDRLIESLPKPSP